MISRWPPSTAVPALMVAMSLVLGWAILNRTSSALLIAAAPVGAVLLVSPVARAALMTFGPIALFGGTGQLTAPKLAFLLAACVAFAASFVASKDPELEAMRRVVRPMFRASGALFCLVVVSLVVATLNGTPFKPWLRDVSPYLLFATTPYFALDAARSLTAQRLRGFLVAAGLIASLAFAVTWFTNRGAAQLPTGWLGLPSVLLPASLVSYGAAAALRGGRRSFLWFLAAVAVVALLAVTGTRSAILLLAAPVAIVALARQEMARRVLRLIAGVPLVAVTAFGVAILVITVAHVNLSVLQSRLNLVSVTGTQYDHSYVSRANEARAAFAMFRAAPLTGAGPGAPINWVDSFGIVRTTPTVDSPLGYLAKFGILGLVVIVVLAVAFVGVIRVLRNAGAELTSRLSLIAFGAVVLLWAVLQVPFEDKGLSVGMLLLLAVSAREFGDSMKLEH